MLGASGDGGPHWSFGPFSNRDPIGRVLNKVRSIGRTVFYPTSHYFQMRRLLLLPTIAMVFVQVGCSTMSPLFPANSPYILAVGGVRHPSNNLSVL